MLCTITFWSLINISDFWLKLNSVFWSLLTLLSVYFVSFKLFSRKTAFISALLFAVAPISVFYAQEVRMYSMLMFLSLWIFYFF
ncbi:MAG: glycosyltransferase family 39 protein [Ignavibacteriales bacterium]|nr:glycosyltransferase family 39 protein [Ignavibacteriales bacterium]